MHHNSLVLLGVDVGTGGVRALALTEVGEIVGEASVPLDATLLATRPDRHEQPPQAWWNAVCRALGALTADLKSYNVPAKALMGVAVDGTSGTLVALDALGEPLRPAMMYNDPRAAREADELNEAAGSFCDKLGYRFKSSFTLAKIAWLKNHEPETFDSAARFVHQADYVLGRLTGEPGVSDYSNALKTGYDLIDLRWPDWIDETLGVTDRLPRVHPPGTKVGLVSRTASAQTGLPAGLPVVTGASDGTAACLASGLRRPGDYNTTLGTTLVFKGVSRQICRHPQGLIYCHKLPGGLWLPGAASNTGAAWIAAWFADSDPPSMDRAAQERLPTDHLAYPLVRTGERFPFLSPLAEGFRVPEPGQATEDRAAEDRGTDDPVEQYAACLQGVAFVERLAYDVLDRVANHSGGQVFATGGGSRSNVWMQCRADATQRVFHRAECPQSAFGTAVLAALGTLYDQLDLAIGEMVHIERTFEPDLAHSGHYNDLFGRFCEELRKRGYR